jgi:hypothetical protein
LAIWRSAEMVTKISPTVRWRERAAKEVVEDRVVRFALLRDDVRPRAEATILALTVINHPPSIESGKHLLRTARGGMVKNTIPLGRTRCASFRCLRGGFDPVP